MVRLPLCDQDSSFLFQKIRKHITGTFTDEWEYEKKKYVSALKSGKTYQIICDDEDETIDDYYDILDVAQVIQAEMYEASDEDEKDALDVKRRRLLMPGFKQIKIEADGDFTVTLYLYLKYASVNR